jgi:hypothetical protein
VCLPGTYSNASGAGLFVEGVRDEVWVDGRARCGSGVGRTRRGVVSLPERAMGAEKGGRKVVGARQWWAGVPPTGGGRLCEGREAEPRGRPVPIGWEVGVGAR